ncbi:hypothetical protein BASA81_016179 [Batrachochytrium salamandrivorans]|nr:hypothetical protein BASA81_016179 [Batrachochytrium salamandrivorans]
MKFNVLVIAAMVITSANAGGRKGLPGWLGGGGMTGSGSSYDTFDNEPEPPSQQDPPKNPSAEVRYFLPNEKDTICGDIQVKLHRLYDKINNRNELFRFRMSGFYKTIGGNIGVRVWEGNDGVETEVTQKSNENETSESRDRKVQEWFKSHPEDQPEVEKTRKDLTDWLGEHLTLWTEFLEIGCSTYGVERLSPEKVLSRMSLVRWHTETTQSQETTQAQETNEINLITF